MPFQLKRAAEAQKNLVFHNHLSFPITAHHRPSSPVIFFPITAHHRLLVTLSYHRLLSLITAHPHNK
ncbi:MAG: hypothetical protein K6A82_05185, partial [Prevotella sp.]|nr:hypothetical protein [Prevotella sp.]